MSYPKGGSKLDYKEKRFEEDIEHFLLTSGGYTKGDLKTYDRDKAIDMSKLIEFIKATQPKQWERYLRNYQDEAEKKLYKRFNEEVEMHGLLHVIRNGINDRGVKLRVAYFRPESTLNPDVIERYEKNILTCTRQFKYSPDNENSIDMLLSLNGIPIVAIELKNQITGQSVENAKAQFNSRNPREKCFQFNTRILVCFAVDLYEVYMTTQLKGKGTYFLPFNQGSGGAGRVGGAGNPENPDGYATSYLWEKVLTKDVLMDILQKYMHLEVKTETRIKNGREIKKTSKKLIFPRYHQLDVVRKLLADTKENGAGNNYLVQHSAGSGKSNSIAWLAYGLSNLHDKDNKPIFNSVIVISDRRVLDKQLQDTISSFDHTLGVVETMGEGKTSQDLKNAINDRKKIIVTTIQKFPVIYEDIDEVKGKRFAVIVDEAHQSQTGSSARAVREALADTEEALREFAEIEGKAEAELEDSEDRLVRELVTQGRHENMSFFAFTATPKEKTLELFGEKQKDGSFKAFHNYSMRQAIEEGFILDVLSNYMTYKTCYKIAKAVEDNPKVPPSPATRTIQRYASLHPHNLQQKTAIIIEQFREVTKNKIKGRGKAMVVTASRLHAVRYYHEFRNYLELKGYDDIDILIAFSGVIKDKGQDYTEEKMNKRKDDTTIRENQLPAEFATDDFNMLIVAEKYQAGFDEPLLHTMFVDKPLSGVKAVQTLSRLNRIHPDKNDTFILDFVNTKEDIEVAFKPYYEATILGEEVNVNLIYNTRTFLRDFKLYNGEDIERFAEIYYKKGKQTEKDLGKIASVLKPIVNKYTELYEDERFNFKRILRNFIKWYSYITQIIRMYDKELHKEHIFATYLEKLLPRATEASIDLEDKVKLEFYKLEQTYKGEIVLEPNIYALEHTEPKPDDRPLTEDEHLEEIIRRINERYKGKFTDGDRVMMETICKEAYYGESSKNLERYVKNNDFEMFTKSIFPEIFKEIAQECYMGSVESFTKLFEDKEFYRLMMEEVGKEVYRKLKNK
jgi:type I restriction enzyme R subunit